MEVGADPRFDTLQWRFERVAWVLLLVVVVVALLGLLGGSGPFTRASREAGDAEVSYDRIVHYSGSTTLELTVPATEDGARVSFNRSFLEGMDVEKVQPEPQSVEAGDERTTYVFEVAAGQDAAELLFTLRPERIGRHRAHLEFDGGTLSFSQFALP